MSFSRLALLVVTVISAALMTTVFMLPSRDANAQDRQPFKLAETPFTFKKIYDGPAATLETDTTTFSGMLDEDEDLIVAGVFRLTRKNALPGEKAVFVNVTLAICGHNGVIVLHSRDFGTDGKLMGETQNPQPIMARPGTPAEATYKALCEAGVKPTPVDPGYKAPGRYTKFWT